ncbi:MAG: efflux RND transporter periplasmic adaptor subunit [Planctomycetota bacterium]|jgi:multidrug efflux pump subunit AcrA (membrane-fusion protein)
MVDQRRPPEQAGLRARRRAGFSTRGLILALVVVLAVPAIAWSVLRNGAWSSGKDDGPMMHRVERGQFIHDITERGSVESASNVEIVSKVKSGRSGSSSSGGGVAILWVVEEGTYVQPGDKVCELDSSSLKDQMFQQEIVVYNSEAVVEQAQNILDAAKIAEKEYLKGTYEEEKLTAENAIEEATEKRDRLKAYWEFSKTMHEKGYVTKLQLQADYSALLQAQNQLELALLKEKVLERYQKEKMELQLAADIKIADAKLNAAKASHALEVTQLNDIKEQFDNCTIHTEKAGQVVYANREGHRGEGDIVIQEGTPIRERQVIIRLPDPKQMQVKAKVNEARVKMVKKGMITTIQLDAFPDTELQGVVDEVKEYPVPTWWGVAVKEYETLIKIIDPSIDLRPGYTAEVKIRVEVLDDVLQVPVQAIIEHGEKHYCVFRDGKRFRARQVKIGSTNDKFVVIEDGLKEGEKVVRNAAAYRKDVGLPELPPETIVPQEELEPEEQSADGRPAGPQAGRPEGPAPENRRGGPQAGRRPGGPRAGRRPGGPQAGGRAGGAQDENQTEGAKGGGRRRGSQAGGRRGGRNSGTAP